MGACDAAHDVVVFAVVMFTLGALVGWTLRTMLEAYRRESYRREFGVNSKMRRRF